jgi:hypothetical protein
MLIALAMTALSVQHLANLARVGLEDSRGIGELLGRMIYQRARDAIAAGGDPEAALRTDQGIRSILESTAAYGRNVTYAAVVDNDGRAIAHSFPAAEGQTIEVGENLAAVLDRGTIDQIRTIYADRALEVVLPLELGDSPFGAIRVGLSPVLIRDDLTKALRPMLLTTVLLSAAAILVGLLLASRILRPIHVINSGLMRLGRGEKVGDIDLPPDEELEGVGESFRAISEKLAARSLGRLMAGVHPRGPESAECDGDPSRARAGAPAAPAAQLAGAGGRGAGAGRARGADPGGDGRARASRRDWLGDQAARRGHHRVRALHPPGRAPARPVDVQLLIAEVIALVDPDARRNGIALRSEVPDGLPELRADPALLRQALLNLALNASQAMADGGRLTMGAKVEKDRRLALTVEIPGAGISADKLDRIFDLYYTTKPEGSGIGLSIVYRIVQLHGGEIEVQSTEGRGTTFRMLLPLG